MSELVKYNKEGQIITIMLANPPVNAVSTKVLNALNVAFDLTVNCAGRFIEEEQWGVCRDRARERQELSFTDTYGSTTLAEHVGVTPGQPANDRIRAHLPRC